MTLDADRARKLLEDERRRLRSGGQMLAKDIEDENASRAKELSDVDQHPAESGTETYYREQDQAQAEAMAEQLAEVEHALEKLTQGTYGVCEVCGRPIGDERLEAMPATRYCLEHEVLTERRAETEPS